MVCQRAISCKRLMETARHYLRGRNEWSGTVLNSARAAVSEFLTFKGPDGGNSIGGLIQTTDGSLTVQPPPEANTARSDFQN